jgi:integrase
MPRKSKPWWWKDRGRWATTIDGKRVVAPAEVVTELDAWTWHAAVVDELTPKPASRSTLTVADVLDAYATWDASQVEAGERNGHTARNDLSAIQAIVNTRLNAVPFGTMLVSRLTRAHYDSLIAAWRRDGYQPNTVAARARKLKTMLRWATKPAIDRGPMIDEIPFQGFPIPAAPATSERYGDRDMAAKWLRWIWRSKRYRREAMFQRCLIHTGARPSELAWATWGDVRWDAMKDSAGNHMAVIVRDEWKNSKKTGRARRIFLPARLIRSMKRRGEGRGADDLIFPSRRGKRHPSAGISGRTYAMRAKAESEGVVFSERSGKAVTNYLWRHTAASSLLMSSVDVATVAELLGTGVAQIQRTYGHLLSDHLARASEKLGRRR